MTGLSALSENDKYQDANSRDLLELRLLVDSNYRRRRPADRGNLPFCCLRRSHPVSSDLCLSPAEKATPMTILEIYLDH